MKIPGLKLQSINRFFEVYASALEHFHTKQMAYLYNMPCTLVSDEKTTVFNDLSKLEGFFNQGATFYKQFGIVKAVPEIWNKRELTARIMQVKVNWHYYGADEKIIYACDYYYTLKADKFNEWKIILSVSVNEKEHMEEWQASRAVHDLIG
jgi:hypothetical protein